VSSIWDASTLDGGAGDDTFKGSGASDVLIGGSGSDTADFSHMGFVTITLGDPSPTGQVQKITRPVHQHRKPHRRRWSGRPGRQRREQRAARPGRPGQSHRRRRRDIMYGGATTMLLRGQRWRRRLGICRRRHRDYVIASASYALTAGSEIEQMQVDSSVGTAAINLTGMSSTTSSSAALETTSSMAVGVLIT